MTAGLESVSFEGSSRDQKSSPGSCASPSPSTSVNIASSRNASGTTQLTTAAGPRSRSRSSSSNSSASTSSLSGPSTPTTTAVMTTTTTTTTTANGSNCEYCRALHDFVPQTDSTTCLSFRKGDLIRTLGKDPSGWWDGELDRHRGWFPSNYVEPCPAPNLTSTPSAPTSAHAPAPPVAGSSPTIEEQPSTSSQLDEALSTSNESRSTTRNDGVRPSHKSSLGTPSESSHPNPNSNLDLKRNVDEAQDHLPPSASHTSVSTFEQVSAALLHELDRAIALVGSAVKDQRIPHYQPTTACVISSVRTVLASTDCLTRDSGVLRATPSLAASRKRILSMLAALVSQARKASSPSTTIEQSSIEAHALLDVALQVVKQVAAFLDDARSLGLTLIPIALLVDDRKGSFDSSTALVPTPVLDAPMMKASRSVPPISLRAARSTGDLEGRRLGAPSSQTDLPARKATRSPSPAGTSPATSFAPESRSSPLLDPESVPRVIRSTSELSSLVSTMHDTLLSTIAAFIGHVHAHARSAPAASFARLIDMTREIIEHVRLILLVVEAVSQHPSLLVGQAGADVPAGLQAEIDNLARCRERLYVATTALVTAARHASSNPSKLLGNESTVTPSVKEAEERKDLLQSATGVLRSGADCVTSVKLCVGYRGERDFLLVIGQGVASAPHSAEASNVAQVPPEPATHLTVSDDRPTRRPSPKGQRGPHTLSMLGRKATSLSCLRDQYEAHTVGNLEQGWAEDGKVEDDEHARVEDALDDDPGHPLFTPAGGTAGASEDKPPPMAVGGAYTAVGVNPPADSNYSLASTSSATTERVFLRTRPVMEQSATVMARGDSGTTSQSTTSSRSAFSGTSRSGDSSWSSVSTAQTETSTAPRTSAETSSAAFNPTPVALRASSSQPDTIKLGSTPSATRSDMATTAASKERTTPWFLDRDYEAREISFSAEGRVTGGTLRCLVERMTLHDVTIDPVFSNTFFLTFRMFTTPSQLAEALFARFDPEVPRGVDDAQHKLWTERKLVPVRLRVYNLFKTWFETYWKPAEDGGVLDSVRAFCTTRLAKAMSNASTRLIALIDKREAELNLTRPVTPAPSPGSGGSSTSFSRIPSSEHPSKLTGKSLPHAFEPNGTSRTGSSTSSIPPAPIVTKALLNSIKFLAVTTQGFSITEVDPLELARQLTILESHVYCRIGVDELLSGDFAKPDGCIRQMSTMSTKLTGWIAETVLNETDTKKRAALLKYFVKVGDRCYQIKNYNALFAVLCALNSSTISRLRRTWDALAPKYRVLLDQMRKATDHGRNYAEYRAAIRQAIPPCLPFVGLFLTDITMCSEGNPPYRVSPVDPSLRLINFDRYQKMSRIVGDLQRFQVPYNLVAVPELQGLLARALDGLAHGGDAASLYRQSLLVEPRKVGSSSASTTSNSISKGSDLFNWIS